MRLRALQGALKRQPGRWLAEHPGRVGGPRVALSGRRGSACCAHGTGHDVMATCQHAYMARLHVLALSAPPFAGRVSLDQGSRAIKGSSERRGAVACVLGS